MSQHPESTTGPFGREAFTELMRRPGMAPAMFLPVERSQWINGRYTRGKNPAPLPAGEFTGIRFQLPDPRNLNKTNEHNVQGDLSQLIGSVVAIRAAHPDLGGTVLSNEIVTSKDLFGTTRARFGLVCDPAGEFKDESAAAAECHKQILAAIRKGWFGIESQPEFDAARGFAGLADWAKGVRLKKAWDWRWLLLLLLLLPFLLPTCRPTDPLAGRTRSFIIVLDRSGSMVPHFGRVKEEAKKTLDSITQSAFQKVLGFFGARYYVDLISYDDNAVSLFGELRPVTEDSAKQLLAGIDNLTAGGGTNLSTAMKLAGEEIKKHGRETTLCIITDGADGSISQMASEIERDRATVEAGFGMKPGDRPLFHANTLTPRLFDVSDRKIAVSPTAAEEEGLARFSELHYGVFGFTSTAAFGQRGMPTSHKAWNTLLWLARMAIIAGAVAYLYPIIRARI